MNNSLTNNLQDFDKQLEMRLETNELLNNEIKALKKLEGFGSTAKDYQPGIIREEIQRRRRFLEELMHSI